MTCLPRVAAAKSAEWSDLADELDRWEEAGRFARLWWRDDDAVAPTPQLDRLLTVAGGAPLALAVIPADAVSALAAALAAHREVAVLHHGWCHANRAIQGKKSEYPPERHPVDVADELEEGRARLRALFGPRAVSVFVPPWNRFADRFVPLLVEAGLTTLSQMAPRKAMPPAGIAVLDVTLDVVTWRETRGFVGSAAALGRLVAALREEREGRHGAIGILTHHLLMDRETEDFMAGLGETLTAHRAAGWADIRELILEPASVS